MALLPQVLRTPLAEVRLRAHLDAGGRRGLVHVVVGTNHLALEVGVVALRRPLRVPVLVGHGRVLERGGGVAGTEARVPVVVRVGGGQRVLAEVVVAPASFPGAVLRCGAASRDVHFIATDRQFRELRYEPLLNLLPRLDEVEQVLVGLPDRSIFLVGIKFFLGQKLSLAGHEVPDRVPSLVERYFVVDLDDFGRPVQLVLVLGDHQLVLPKLRPVH